MSDTEPPYELRVTGPAERQLQRLPEGTAAAIVEFMLSALVTIHIGSADDSSENSPDSAPHDAAPTESCTRSTTLDVSWWCFESTTAPGCTSRAEPIDTRGETPAHPDPCATCSAFRNRARTDQRVK